MISLTQIGLGVFALGMLGLASVAIHDLTVQLGEKRATLKAMFGTKVVG